jgi:hypothetical protein
MRKEKAMTEREEWARTVAPASESSKKAMEELYTRLNAAHEEKKAKAKAAEA